MKLYRTFIIIALLLTAYSGKANNSKIIIWFNDSSKMEVFFSEYPIFEYSDDILYLRGNNSLLSWPLSQIVKLTIEKDSVVETNVHGILPEGQDKQNANFDNCEIYDISGKYISKQIRSLSELPQGVYIIKKGCVITKVAIR